MYITDVTQRPFFLSHYPRALVSSPFFDPQTSWFPNRGWIYKDLYGLATSSPLVALHPDWILKDGSGNKLYIPFACSGVCPACACSQYAMDPGNAAVRANWISEANAKLVAGVYKGLLLDDVNLLISRVSDGAGNPVVPNDPRTTGPMSQGAWEDYMAGFCEAIRAAEPGYEIVHNALWFAGSGASDPAIAREIHAADVIAIERGINDSGITNDSGTFGIQTFFAYADWVHSQGRHLYLDSLNQTTIPAREYGLAGYFLLNDGGDYLANLTGGTPVDWWTQGYDLVLGGPLTGRFQTFGVWERDFSFGKVFLNEPSAPPQPNVPLGGTYQSRDGTIFSGSTFTMPAGTSGLVLQQLSTTTTTAGPTTTTTTSTAPVPGCGGDVDGDGKVTIGDSLTIAQYAVGQRACGFGQFTHPERCDVNLDGLCTNADAVVIAQCLVSSGGCHLPCGSFTCPPAPDPHATVVDCTHVQFFWTLVPGSTQTCVQDVAGGAPICAPVPTTSIIVETAQNTTQTWVIYGIVNGGQSAPSLPLVTRTPPCACTPPPMAPSPPTNFAGSASDCRHVVLTWTASPSTDISSYCAGNRLGMSHPDGCVGGSFTTMTLVVPASPVPYHRTYSLWATDTFGQMSSTAPATPPLFITVNIPAC